MGDVLRPSPYQAKALAAPADLNQLHPGGRGGGKTMCMELQIVRHCAEHADRAHVIVVRRTFPGLRDLERSLHHVLVRAFGRQVRWNQQDHVFRLPIEATIEMRCYEDGPTSRRSRVARRR